MPKRTAVLAYVAISIAVGALALTDHADAALAIAVPAYSGLTGVLHQRVARVEESIGPANGRTLRELVEHTNDVVQRLEHQRTRMHAVLGALTPPNARLELELLELKEDSHELKANVAELLERARFDEGR